MTAQEWLDELQAKAKAVTPGPWKHNIEPLRDGMGFIWPFSSIESEDAKAIEDEEENVTDNITRADAAYIVAACNAVPRLIEMLVFLASLASEDDESVDAIERRIQWAYNETRPKE